MTIPKQIIAKALEGGWMPWETGIPFNIEMNETMRDKWLDIGTNSTGGHRMKESLSYSAGWGQGARETYIVLDPLFWQALFKKYVVGLPFKINERSLPQWMQQANQFFELHLVGGDTESFWNNLVKKL